MIINAKAVPLPLSELYASPTLKAPNIVKNIGIKVNIEITVCMIKYVTTVEPQYFQKGDFPSLFG